MNNDFFKNQLIILVVVIMVYSLLSFLGITGGRGGSPYIDKTPEYPYEAPVNNTPKGGGRLFK